MATLMMVVKSCSLTKGKAVVVAACTQSRFFRWPKAAATVPSYRAVA